MAFCIGRQYIGKSSLMQNYHADAYTIQNIRTTTQLFAFHSNFKKKNTSTDAIFCDIIKQGEIYVVSINV